MKQKSIEISLNWLTQLNKVLYKIGISWRKSGNIASLMNFVLIHVNIKSFLRKSYKIQKPTERKWQTSCLKNMKFKVCSLPLNPCYHLFPLVDNQVSLSTLDMVLLVLFRYLRVSKFHMLLERILYLVKLLLSIFTNSLILMEFLKEILVNQLGYRLYQISKKNNASFLLILLLMRLKLRRALNWQWATNYQMDHLLLSILQDSWLQRLSSSLIWSKCKVT